MPISRRNSIPAPRCWSRSTPSKCRSTANASNAAAFADFDTERRAQELVGLEFRIECDEDEDDEFYLEDLIGFAVTCTEAGADGAKGAAAFTGSVTDYYDSDANPLFELEIGGRTVLLPAAEEFIAHIDFGGRTMKLVLPEGLLDL